MNANMPGELVMQPRVNVSALADIVEEMVAGGVSRLQDRQWLCQHATAAGLGQHEQAALETLRARLCVSGAALLDAAITGLGNW